MSNVKVNTVCGEVSSSELGLTLAHEHLVIGMPGWEYDNTMAPFNRKEAVDACMETMRQIKAVGIKTLIDPAPMDVGRMPDLYREVSEKSGIHIICTTGYYSESAGASTYWKSLAAFKDVVDDIAEMFITEITSGIANTGIKAGAIKVASSEGAITEYERRFFRAAARAHKETGVPIITHTTGGTMGPEQAELLIAEGANPGNIMIGHMSDNVDMAYHLSVLQQGVFDSMDRLGLQGIENIPMDEEKYPVIIELIKTGYNRQIMLSHDSIAYWLGRRIFDQIPEEARWMLENSHPLHLFQNIIPVLKKGGVTDEQVRIVLEDNPRSLFEAR
jgi:phosphotriesterase-related protein